MAALSLFSGIGGLCEGVKLAGFPVGTALEHDRYAAQNYRLNFPSTRLFEGDVAQFLDPEHFDAHFEQYIAPLGNLDLIFGGPPCQGFSQIGPRDPLDPRNELYLHIIRLANLLRPRFLLIENVPNMLLMRKGMFKDRILKALHDIGYSNIGLAVLNAADYGVPQARKRVFILASATVRYPLQQALDQAALALRQPIITVNQAISDLPTTVVDSGKTLLYRPAASALSTYQREMRLDHTGAVFYGKGIKQSQYQLALRGEEGDTEFLLHNHHTKDIQERRLALIRLLAPGMKADSLPKEVWNNARPEKWRRFDGNKPAHTLLAQMHRDLSEWVHPNLDRWITVREALRLQSFNDSFVLKTSEWQQLKQVGNAVPPLLGYVPATALQFAAAKDDGLTLPFNPQNQLLLY